MKTEKLKDNATVAERFEFLAKCARHLEDGGKVVFINQYDITIIIGDMKNLTINDAHRLTIYHKPKTKIIPYTAETFPKDWNTKVVTRKSIDYKIQYIISSVDFTTTECLINKEWITFKTLCDDFTWSDGSPCGVEVEESV